jgi:hypothetical protein
VATLDLPSKLGWRDFEARVVVEFGADTRLAIRFQFKPNLLSWIGPIQFKSVTDTIEAVAADEWTRDLRVSIDGRDGAFALCVEVDESNIEEEIERWSESLTSFRDEVERRLEKSVDGSTWSFQFEESVKIACQQYLLYFGEFLADVGVPAKTALREDAGRILFSVVPKNEQDALSAIGEALDIYLSLPSAPIRQSVDDDIEVLKLAANIQHLRAQLNLAKAMLHTQEATISAQKRALDLYDRLDAPRELQRPSPDPDREEFFGGTVSLTRFVGKGFEVSFAEIFRQLRQKFRR